MPTECTLERFEFEAVARRAVVACFDGGDITSNAGALLLGQVGRVRGSRGSRPGDRFPGNDAKE
jgi:hypothetical protein